MAKHRGSGRAPRSGGGGNHRTPSGCAVVALALLALPLGAVAAAAGFVIRVVA